MYLDSIFIEIWCQLSNKWYTSIGLDNGMAPNRRQAIMWSNVGLFINTYIRLSAPMN